MIVIYLYKMLNIPIESNLNIFHDDILHSIFTFTPTFELVLVCRRWYDIIVKHNVCAKCNKITSICENKIWRTDEDDMCCHMARCDGKDYKVLDVELVNVIALKHVFNILNKNVIEVSMKFTCDNELHISTMNSQKDVLINAKLNRNYFTQYKIKTKNVYVGVQVKDFLRMLNDFGKKSKIQIVSYGNYIRLFSPNVNHKCQLYYVPYNNIRVPSKKYNVEFLINSAEFINDLAELNNCEKITFKTADAKLYLNSDKFCYPIKNQSGKNFGISFENKNLKANIIKNPYDEIKLSLCEEYPLLISYSMGIFGELDVYIVPVIQ